MFQSLGNLLNNNIKRNGFSQRVEHALVLEIFSKVLLSLMGTEFSEKVKPTYLRGKVLTIACLSSVVAQEVRFREVEIVQEINKRCEKEVVAKLNYML